MLCCVGTRFCPTSLSVCLALLQPLSAASLLGQPQAVGVQRQGSPLAVYNLPPVVAPGAQPSPRRGQGQVLVVAAGEQDVLPAGGLLLAWTGRQGTRSP